MNELDDIAIHEVSYTISPDGSNFCHCTPEILGPLSNRILSLDYSRMRLVRVNILYDWISHDGICVPKLILQFQNSRIDRGILFSIICILHVVPLDFSSPALTKELPDLNAFTPFAEVDSSMEIHYYSNTCEDADPCQEYCIDSSITLRIPDSGKSIVIDCFKLELYFDNWY